MPAELEPDSFESVLAEAAWELRADDQFTDADGYLNGIGDVSAFALREAGAAALAERYEQQYDTGYLVWFQLRGRTVAVVEFGNDEGLRSGSDLVNSAFQTARDAS